MEDLTYQKFLDHYWEARKYFPYENIVGLFLQGSQNYNLATEESDVDTKLVVTPTLDDIARNRKPVSTTHIRANNEHIDFKDVRLMIDCFKKQNINFIEILFTDYYLIGEDYKYLWRLLVKNRELIAHYDTNRAVKCIKGMALEKHHALEHPYPNKITTLEKFGYDPKQLHHIVRLEDFLSRYINGISYAECLIPTDPEFLIDIKKGYYDLEMAREMATESLKSITELADWYCSHKNPINKEAEELLDEVQYKIIKKSIKMEI